MQLSALSASSLDPDYVPTNNDHVDQAHDSATLSREIGDDPLQHVKTGEAFQVSNSGCSQSTIVPNSGFAQSSLLEEAVTDQQQRSMSSCDVSLGPGTLTCNTDVEPARVPSADQSIDLKNAYKMGPQASDV